jgi:uncharacterized lipoprotein YddW (UPF0748 family)
LSPVSVIASVTRYLSPILAAALWLGCSNGSSLEVDASELQQSTDTAETSEPGLRTPVRGLWVLAEGSERVLEDAAKGPRLIADALGMGATDLFVQVYRGGRAWYDADLADRGPYDALLEKTGVDTLAALITAAHAEGIRVHAWVNVLSLSRNRNAPILSDLGRDAVLVDRHGRSILDYPDLEVPAPDGAWSRMGTRGVYLDAAAPGVSERLTATFRELIERYPELDGLHLDYIRHPGALPFVPGARFGVGLDFGYGATSRARFNAETGKSGPYADPANPDPAHLTNANAWDDWRRQKVTDLVAEIGQACRAVRADLILSAAVNSYADRAYLSLAQDWKRWLEADLIDLAIPMIYTLDDRLLRYQVEAFAGAPHAERVWPGLGTWLFAKRPTRALGQIGIARSAGFETDVLFSYDSIVAEPGLREALLEAGPPVRAEAP